MATPILCNMILFVSLLLHYSLIWHSMTMLLSQIWKITLYLSEYWDDPYALGTVGKPQSIAFRRYPDRCGTFSCC
ncbi:hypothetical protein P691DRAFT_768761 [Macrolepiota fuliginosa MF-IS2]|uniref:Uncharacterized protein n=1 Tax=Macrolepiota fuliginosa MF-IS2 TaxID=1400762 RepID=A0A9P5WXP8_9AGAR|nr:hypothetical protein P691DRAFT_768761 [Macrolepiota fuliginosa MF-IS2]